MHVVHRMTLFVILTFFISGCSGAGGPDQFVASESAPGARPGSQASRPDSAATPDAATATKSPRHIIREGELGFETGDQAQTRTEILRSVEAHHGYLSENSEHRSDSRIEQVMVIRVPPDQFDGLLEDISRGVVDFDVRRVQAIDVTEAYVDVEARLKTRKETETRYQELLKQAGSVEDVLKIEEQIDRLRVEIESTEGRLRLLQDRESWSTLRVQFYQTTGSAPMFVVRFLKSLSAGWTGVVETVIVIAALWPLLVIGLLIAVLVRFRNRRESTKKVRA